MTTIHIVSRQIGTAYPHALFAKILRAEGFNVEVFAFDTAMGPLNTFQAQPQRIENFSDYQSKMKDRPQLIFTGTSEMAEDDTSFWHWGFENQVPTLAWLDQIVNLEKRFVSMADSSRLPKILLTNDSPTLRELSGRGPYTRVECVGSPYIDELLRSTNRSSVNPGIAFFPSEPAPADYKEKNGFDDIDAFGEAFNFFRTVSQATKNTWQICVKLHPRDSVSRFQSELQRRYPEAHCTFSDLTKEQAFSQSQVICGMRSMFLFEAANLGIPTLSFQPHRKTTCAYLDSHQNVMTFTEPPADIKKPLDFISSDRTASAEGFQKERFFSLLNELKVRP